MDSAGKIINDIVNALINIGFFLLIIFVIWIRIKKQKGGGRLNFEDIFKSLSSVAKPPTDTKPPAVPQPPASDTVQSNTAKPGMELMALTGVFNKLLAPVPVAKLKKRQKYLQIALNSTLNEAREIIYKLPRSESILVEVGTPLIKIYGQKAIRDIKAISPAGTYIVADTKTADLADREVAMVAQAGAHAATCLGVAPIETIDVFIEECVKYSIDSMIDMMNVERPLMILKQLKKLPDVVILHRGVDESEFSKEKQIPYYQIQQIKGNFNISVSVAGGDTSREVQRAFFNNADIVVVWKDFYQSTSDTASLAQSFLNNIKTK